MVLIWSRSLAGDHVSIVVCYTGGTCGDLVTALIDPRDCEIHNGRVIHVPQRCELKKPHQFTDDMQKDQYLEQAFQSYQSISSHDLEYHVDRGHDFLTITVQDPKIALWAAERFQSLHRPQVWHEMVEHCGAKDVRGYAQILIDYSKMVANRAPHRVHLEHIVQGHAVTEIERILGMSVSMAAQQLYFDWLEKQQT